MRPSVRTALRAGAVLSVTVGLPVLAGALVARRAAALYEGPTVEPDPALERVSIGDLPGWAHRVGDGRRWAVLLPGLGSHPLRHQDLAAHLADRGWSVLFASHSARWPATRHTYGRVEQDDARAWLRWVADRGGHEVVLLGWSFGASLWLRLLANAPAPAGTAPAELPVRVRSVVLTGPLSDWSDAIGHGVGGGALGRVVAGLARWTLRAPVLSRSAGQPSPVDIVRPPLPSSDGDVPQLVVVHSAADRTVPLSSSRRLVQTWPGRASLTEIPGARHGAERDVDPAAWLDAVDGAV